MYEDVKVAIKYFSSVGQIGFLVVATALMGLGLGYLLDRMIGTGSLCKVIFMIAGCFAGFYQAYKVIMRMVERDDKS
jgi:F0F1-type ATP synthase assembly protein I